MFKYKKPLFASYKLVGTPFDSIGRPVLESFKPKKTKRHDKARLQNFYKGVLILPVDSIKHYGIDGSFDIYFVPVPYSETAGVNYVSYLINDTPDKTIKKIAIATSLQSHAGATPSDSPKLLLFSSYTLNPSPPYNR